MEGRGQYVLVFFFHARFQPPPSPILAFASLLQNLLLQSLTEGWPGIAIKQILTVIRKSGRRYRRRNKLKNT